MIESEHDESQIAFYCKLSLLELCHSKENQDLIEEMVNSISIYDVIIERDGSLLKFDLFLANQLRGKSVIRKHYSSIHTQILMD